jgi:endonuclease IV
MKDLILGAHVSLNENLNKAFEILDVIQVFITSPGTMKMPEFLHPFFERYKPWAHIPLIIHGPYTGSFIHDYRDRRSRFLQNYTVTLINIAMAMKFTLRFVIHLGVIPQGRSSKEAVYNIKMNLKELDKRVKHIKGDFRVCLENDSGCIGRSNVNTAIGIFYLMKRNKYPWLGSCLDTQHAFASGFSMDGWVGSALSADVIHLNSIPQHIIKGGCKDEHSKHLLKDSQCKRVLAEVIWTAKRQQIPLILERSGWELITADITHTHKLCKAFENKTVNTLVKREN